MPPKGVMGKLASAAKTAKCNAQSHNHTRVTMRKLLPKWQTMLATAMLVFQLAKAAHEPLPWEDEPNYGGWVSDYLHDAFALCRKHPHLYRDLQTGYPKFPDNEDSLLKLLEQQMRIS